MKTTARKQQNFSNKVAWGAIFLYLQLASKCVPPAEGSMCLTHVLAQDYATDSCGYCRICWHARPALLEGDYVSQLYRADRDPGNKEVGICGNRSPNTMSFGHFYCKPFPSHPRALLPSPGGGRPVFMAKTSSLSSMLARLASSYTSCGLRSRWTPPAK